MSVDVDPIQRRRSQVSPLAMLRARWSAARSQEFSTLIDGDWYQNMYPLASSRQPVIDYLSTGWREGRDPNPFFDSDWYLAENPDVAAGGMNPLTHYLEFGWREGRDPNPFFDSDWYLAENPDVAAGGMNPLTHYVLVGASEGLTTCGLQRDFSYLAPWPECITRAPARSNQSKRVAILIPVHGGSAYTHRCLHALRRSGAFELADIVVVDDGSPVPVSSELQPHDDYRIVRYEENGGFLNACNRTISMLRTYDYVLLLNNDTEPLLGFLHELVLWADKHPRAGAVGSLLVFPDATIQEAGGIVFSDGSAANYGRGQHMSWPAASFARPVDYASAACLLVRVSALRQDWLFDPRFMPAYYEDTDLAMDMRERGHEVWFLPTSVVVHHEGRSHGTDVAEKGSTKSYQVFNAERFASKWRDTLTQHMAPDAIKDQAANRLANVSVAVVWIDNSAPRPNQDSGSVRAQGLLQVASGLGLRVVFVPTFESPNSSECRALGNLSVAVAGSLEEARWLCHQLALKPITVWLTRPESAESVLMKARSTFPQARLIYDSVDMHSLRLKRERDLQQTSIKEYEYASMLALERAVARVVDCFVVVSGVDGEFLSRLHGGVETQVISNIHVVEVGQRRPEEVTGLVFVGGFQHRPNVDAVLWFAEEVWPLLPARVRERGWTIAGSKMPAMIRELASPLINPIGYVGNIEQLIRSSCISVAPLRFGAGVKGKVGQSLALGTPVIGTSIAFEGMPVIHGRDAWVADDAESFAIGISTILDNCLIRETLSANGQELIREGFSPELASEQLRKVIIDRPLQSVNSIQLESL